MFNIKQYLDQVLNNQDILNLTADNEVYFIHTTGASAPYVEYEVFDENGELWEEGRETSTNYFVQVDIFSLTDYTELENKIREVMLNAGFERSMAADLYEKDTALYHKAMRFIITGDN